MAFQMIDGVIRDLPSCCNGLCGNGANGNATNQSGPGSCCYAVNISYCKFGFGQRITNYLIDNFQVCTRCHFRDNATMFGMSLYL